MEAVDIPGLPDFPIHRVPEADLIPALAAGQAIEAQFKPTRSQTAYRLPIWRVQCTCHRPQ